MAVSKRRGKRDHGNATVAAKPWHSSGFIVLVVLVLAVTVSAVEIISTVRNYAISVAELHSLQREQEHLEQRKRDLDDTIHRWNDKAYITAQARERLGFVFPKEQAVRVLHPEAVTGVVPRSFVNAQSAQSDHMPLPWYSDLAYALRKADKPDTVAFETSK